MVIICIFMQIKASRHQNVNKLEGKTNQEHDFPTSPEKIDQSDEVNSLQKEAMEIDDERESTENKVSVSDPQIGEHIKTRMKKLLVFGVMFSHK